MRSAILCVAVMAASPLAAIQGPPQPATQTLAFEVASIKPSSPDADGTSWGTGPGGRWSMRNMAVSVMIREAYPAQAPDLIGAPDWVTSDRYDVDALPEGNPTRDEIRLMLQTLLRERVRLAVHYETHERPVYALVVARDDGRTPSALVRSTIDCDAVNAARREGRTLDVPGPANGARPCVWQSSYGPDGVTVRFGGLPLSRLGESLGDVDGRIVIDRTGLTGGFEFTLRFNQMPTPDGDIPSLFTALEEQLGLKLEPARAPLQVLAIDHVERPSEN